VGQTVQIERMSYGAAAIGRLPDGKAVFVDGAAPGDVCEVHVVEEKRSFARAELTEVLEASAARVALDAKRCVGDSIPGAPWAHLAYSAQLEAKRQNLVEALVRVGKMERAIVEGLVGACVPSKREWGYRNKVELAAFPDAAGRFCLGMHEPGSDSTVAMQTAPLANRFLERAPRALTWALRAKRDAARGFLAGGGLTLVAVLVLAVWGLADFDGLFILFHQLSFDNGLWLMNPAENLLIRLMPIQFFIHEAAVLAASWLGLMALAMAAAWTMRRSRGGGSEQT